MAEGWSRVRRDRAVKVVTVVGARPQFVKAAPVSAALRKVAAEVLVHTGQHYDPEMSAAFFEELHLPDPDHHLGAGSGMHGEQTASILSRLEPILVAERPDWVIVYGDTNSTLAGALAAVKLHLPIAHVEAGLRSFDRRMPEEVNRVVTDHLATLCFAPSRTAVDNLAAEGIRQGVIDVGDVMVDSLMSVRDQLPHDPPVARAAGLGRGEYVLATLHRASTTDDPARLEKAVDLLTGLGRPVILPLHPRTRAALAQHSLMGALTSAGTVIVPPQGYVSLLGLLSAALAVVTDSGGVQKEAYLLEVPCITMRAETEWVETVEAGWNSLVALDAEAARRALLRARPLYHPPLYGDGKAAERIVAALVPGGRLD
jgi:UDP-N-acetylglucosamine 2-epimerase